MRIHVSLGLALFLAGCGGDRGSPDPLVAQDDLFTTSEDAPLDLDAEQGLLANDEGATTALVDLPPQHGTVVLSNDGSFSWTPDADFAGTDSFSYVAMRGDRTSDPATVTLQVSAVNDAPQAFPDEFTVLEDETLDVAADGILANDGDVDGDLLTIELIVGTSNGTLTVLDNGSIEYAPIEDFNGFDYFTYVVSDGIASSAPVTVELTVSPLNDAPIAFADNHSTDEDVPLVLPAPGILANDGDVDGDPLFAVLQTSPSSGDVTLGADGTLTYAPDPEFSGTDSFTYSVTDGTAMSMTVTVTIDVAVIEDPPTVANDAFSLDEDTSFGAPAPGVLANDSDPDSAVLRALEETPPSNGALTLNTDGSFAYTPDPDFFGTDSFTYRATDGLTLSSSATVTLTVDRMAGPASVSVSTNHAEKLTVTFSAVPGATGYVLYAASDSTVSPSNYASLPGGRRVTASSRPAKILDVHRSPMFVVVTASDANGESAPSATAPGSTNLRSFQRQTTVDNVNVGGSPGGHRVAVGAQKNAAAIWTRANEVRTSFYDTSTRTWTPSVVFDVATTSPELQIAGLTSGAVVAWRDGTEAQFSIGSETGWTTPSEIVAGGSLSTILLSASSTGEHLRAVWRDTSGAIALSEFNGTAFDSPTLVATTSASLGGIAVDDFGTSLVSWGTLEAGTVRLWGTHLAAGSSNPATSLVRQSSNSLQVGKAALSANGAFAVLLWTEYDGVRNNGFASRWTTVGGWTPPESYESTAESVFTNLTPFGIDDFGRVLAITTLPHPTFGWEEVVAMRYEPSTGWTGPLVIGTSQPNNGHSRRPALDMTPGGSAAVVWSTEHILAFTETVRGNRFFPDKDGWQTEAYVDGLTGSSGIPAFLAIDLHRRGGGMYVWRDGSLGSPAAKIRSGEVSCGCLPTEDPL